MQERSIEELIKELEETKQQLRETQYQLEDATDTIEAIRVGAVDALVINSQDGHQLYSLENADLSFRIFIEQMSEGAVTLNQSGSIQYCNSRFSEWMQVPLDKIIGKLMQHFIKQGDHTLWNTLFNQSWDKETKGQLLVVAANQTEIPVSVSFKMLAIDGQQSMSLIISDLTEQKEARQLLVNKNLQLEKAQAETVALNAELEDKVIKRTAELFNNQQYLSSVLETMAEGVVLANAGNNITYANLMAQKILGFEQQDIIDRKYNDGRWINQKLDGSVLSEDEHPLRLVMQTGEPVFDFEIGIKKPLSELFYISLNAAPIKSETGEIVGSIGTFMDVTSRRIIVQQKDEFISVASHELRTPITALKASLQLLDRLKKTPESPLIPKLIDQSNKSLLKVGRLIDDLLDATKVNQGQLVLKKSVFNVSELVSESCQQIRNHDHVTFIETGDKSIRIEADKDRLDQVLTNFINNALKYAPQSASINIDYVRTDKGVKISVTDFGPGIEKGKLKHIFDRYYRIDEAGRQYSGLGLGLYICSEIINKHNGKIGVDSVLGQGSTFWFLIPENSTVVSSIS